MKSPGVYKCPDDPTAGVPGSDITPVSYFYNCNLAGTAGLGLKVSQVGEPSQTALAGEDTGVLNNVTAISQAPTDAAGDFADALFPNGSYITKGPLYEVLEPPYGPQCNNWPNFAGGPCTCPSGTWKVSEQLSPPHGVYGAIVDYACEFPVIIHTPANWQNILATDAHVKFCNIATLEGGLTYQSNTTASLSFPVQSN